MENSHAMIVGRLFFRCPLMTRFSCWQVLESESRVKENLSECDSQKEELEIRCSEVEREKEELNQTVG